MLQFFPPSTPFHSLLFFFKRSAPNRWGLLHKRTDEMFFSSLSLSNYPLSPHSLASFKQRGLPPHTPYVYLFCCPSFCCLFFSCGRPIAGTEMLISRSRWSPNCGPWYVARQMRPLWPSNDLQTNWKSLARSSSALPPTWQHGCFSPLPFSSGTWGGYWPRLSQSSHAQQHLSQLFSYDVFTETKSRPFNWATSLTVAWSLLTTTTRRPSTSVTFLVSSIHRQCSYPQTKCFWLSSKPLTC